MYRKINQLGQENKPVISYNVLEVKTAEHKSDLLQKNNILCVDIHATWCQPCKHIAPKYAELAKKYNSPGSMLLVKEDLELNLSESFDIRAVPSFLIFVQGKLHTKITGCDLGEVEGALQSLASGPSETMHPQVNPGNPGMTRPQQRMPTNPHYNQRSTYDGPSFNKSNRF